MSLVKELSLDTTPTYYINFDMDVALSQSPIDVKSITW